MTRFMKTALAVAFAGGGMTGAQNAMAEAYAMAFNDVWDFQISTIAGSFTPNSLNTVSKAQAEYTPPGGSGSSSDNLDAAVVNRGTAARANNAFRTGTGAYPSLLGKTPGNGYSVGDSVIPSPQVLPPSFGEATLYGESYSPDAVGTGADQIGDSLGEAELNGVITVTEGTVLQFDFKALPYLIAQVTGDMGDFAAADIDFSITIRTTGPNPVTAFGWSPDGSAGGITNGTELIDDADLNIEISANELVNSDVYDPGTTEAACNDGSGNCEYSAQTNALAAGTYTINITMTGNTRTETVPEPATLALISGGLIGAGFLRRRRRKG